MFRELSNEKKVRPFLFISSKPDEIESKWWLAAAKKKKEKDEVSVWKCHVMARRLKIYVVNSYKLTVFNVCDVPDTGKIIILSQYLL